MDNENIEKDISKKPMIKWKKVLLIGTLGLLSIITIAIVLFFAFLDAMFGPTPPSKEEIKNIVINNQELFSQTVDSIKKLEKNLYTIRDAKHFPPQKDTSIKGLYAEVHTDDGYKEIPFHNQVIEELFNKTKILQSIEIHDYCIDFYVGGIFRDYGCSIIWSSDNKHFVSAGTETEEIINGSSYEWKENNGDNRRYIERITDKWYFYEESF